MKMAVRLAGLILSVRLATLARLHPETSGPTAGSCWFRWVKWWSEEEDLDRGDKEEGSLRSDLRFYRCRWSLIPLFIWSLFSVSSVVCVVIVGWLSVLLYSYLCSPTNGSYLFARWVPLGGGLLIYLKVISQ